jgi:mycothiol maleylpyruvate isomerase-like protein
VTVDRVAGQVRPTTAGDLLERAESAWPRFLGAIHHVGPRHLDQETPSGWRYRDLVAHAAVWHRIAGRGLQAIHETGALPEERLEATDAINAQAARDAEGVPPERLLADLETSWNEVREVLAALTDEDLRAYDGFAIGVAAENTWEHYEEHRPELLAARPDSAVTFLARFDEDWQLVHEALARLGEGGLDQPIGTGWKYRDLVAHATGWLVDATGRLPQVRADPQVVFEPVDVDAFNAASLEARRERTAAELLAELREAEARFRDAVAVLRSDELGDRRILGFLAARSYLHVDEHLPELEAARRS